MLTAAGAFKPILFKLDQLSGVPEELAEVRQEVVSLRGELRDALQELGATREALAETTAQLQAAREEITTLKQGQTTVVAGPVRARGYFENDYMSKRTFFAQRPNIPRPAGVTPRNISYEHVAAVLPQLVKPHRQEVVGQVGSIFYGLITYSVDTLAKVVQKILKEEYPSDADA